MKWFFGILLLIAAGLAGAYWWAGKDEIPLTDAERAAAPGEFVELTDGKLHYLERGPENGPVILMGAWILYTALYLRTKCLLFGGKWVPSYSV